MKPTKRRKENIARVFFNLSQAIFIALVIGRITSPERITLSAFVAGIILFITFLTFGYIIDKGE